MTTVIEILKKTIEINKLVEDWGYTQPRLFKGVVEEELGHLNIVVTPIDNDECNFTPSLSRSLETLLNCDVVVTSENELGEDYRDQILKEAIPLHDKEGLLKYYGKDYSFDPPDQKMQSQVNIDTRELVRKHLIAERKRKREEELRTGVTALSISDKKQKLSDSNVNATPIRNN